MGSQQLCAKHCASNTQTLTHSTKSLEACQAAWEKHWIRNLHCHHVKRGSGYRNQGLKGRSSRPSSKPWSWAKKNKMLTPHYLAQKQKDTFQLAQNYVRSLSLNISKLHVFFPKSCSLNSDHLPPQTVITILCPTWSWRQRPAWSFPLSRLFLLVYCYYYLQKTVRASFQSFIFPKGIQGTKQNRSSTFNVCESFINVKGVEVFLHIQLLPFVHLNSVHWVSMRCLV